MIEVQCQQCGFQKAVGMEYAGKRVRCPKCSNTIQLLNPNEQFTERAPVASLTQSARSSATRYNIDEFVAKTKQRDRGEGLFELESDRVLEVNLGDSVWIKTGSMIGFRGPVRFVRERILQFGVKRLLKQFFTGEGITLTNASGKGKIYLADAGKKVSILRLNGETIYVNGNDILAFEKTLSWDVKLLRQFGAMLSGGLFNVKLSGSGMVAISTHYDPLTLEVTPNSPVTTDPNATVAWSGSLAPEFKIDVQLKTFFGRGSGETIQAQFRGNGFVVVQPFEESLMPAGGASASSSSGSKPAPILQVALVIIIFLIYAVSGILKSGLHK